MMDGIGDGIEFAFKFLLVVIGLLVLAILGLLAVVIF